MMPSADPQNRQKFTENSQKLIDAARDALSKSYSPYSKFCVGAALMTEAGNLFIGANVENISYGLTICAERVAIGSAIAHEGPLMRIKAMAVISAARIPVSPCGACRQVIQEFGPESRIIYPSSSGFKEVPLSHLLPGAFCEFVSTQEDGSQTRIQGKR